MIVNRNFYKNIFSKHQQKIRTGNKPRHLRLIAWLHRTVACTPTDVEKKVQDKLLPEPALFSLCIVILKSEPWANDYCGGIGRIQTTRGRRQDGIRGGLPFLPRKPNGSRVAGAPSPPRYVRVITNTGSGKEPCECFFLATSLVLLVLLFPPRPTMLNGKSNHAICPITVWSALDLYALLHFESSEKPSGYVRLVHFFHSGQIAFSLKTLLVMSPSPRRCV